MKYIDTENLDQLPGTRLEEDDIFSFHCHSGLDCFNLCCRNLNLFLYPYDVIRLKNRLGITSDQFIDEYTDIVLRPSEFFPEVLLRMADNEEKTCPFLTESGCSVYPDRPDTCRTFPVEQGTLYDAKTKKTKLIHFFRPPDFCLGQHENRPLTTKTWAKDQDAVTYNKMTVRWAEIKRLFQTDPWGKEGPEGPRGKMAFMASYNTDHFREFILGSSFLKRYKVKSAVLKKIKKQDDELLTFGFDWIKFYLWGMKTKYFRLR
ncbi:YkgJ family cysteine cluster protein [Desulfonema magnum]|uniref:Zinc- or iron-chelating domain-containing protein n=1 Tax=Desulfonema magnum TaxID=45655 RepID=A0A975BMX2_9BACT|nr:YkgJ family cysteine cluster protein [Desulfonema magnum]QTA88385.1 Putative zinc- or iron-chelating domain-containing protein [Desulfonema magnum]